MLSIFTDHARARMQQRGIAAAAVETLLDYGRERHLHSKGREMVFFDKAARARLFRDNPAAAREAERLCRTYAVVGRDGTVVTVGHRYRRVPRG
jgi:RimJ/RimL family protein N-acetyltransferase